MSNSLIVNKPEVKVIADSIYNEERITTLQVKYWRPLLPEINTHRAFSRNAASSRAQSFNKRIEQVINSPVLPAHWNAEKPGMVGGEEFDEETKDLINYHIHKLACHTVGRLEAINALVKGKTGKEIHKQYLNRYLEPFISTTQLITATDWDNFFRLRMAEDAQPEVKDLATEMFYAIQESSPVTSKLHLPYVTKEELDEYEKLTAIKISVARCARVSYRAYEGNIKLEKDLELYNRLLTSGHMSPFEHVAIPGESRYYYNLACWKSLRYLLDHEYDSDSRAVFGS